MHKVFYASGFLFNLENQQILLHQSKQKTDTVSLWSMFGKTNDKKEDPLLTFQRAIYNALKVKLAKEHIHPVYNYFHSVNNRMHYIYYGQVTKMQNYTFPGETLSWFTFKQTLKLRFTEETRQDIVVAQRVINAWGRITANTQYYPPTS